MIFGCLKVVTPEGAPSEEASKAQSFTKKILKSFGESWCICDLVA